MNLLLTGCFNYSEEQMAALRSLGYNVYFMQQEKDDLPIDTSELDVIVCNGLSSRMILMDLLNLNSSN